MAANDIWPALEHSRHVRERTRENACRLAFSYARFTTKGWGQHVRPDVIDFDVTFIEMPFFSSSPVLNTDGDNPDLVDTRFPLAQAFVYEWRQDGNGFYTGAWVAFTVTTVMFQLTPTLPSAPDPGYVIEHHMTWQGNAIKDLPAHVLDF